MGVEHVHVSPFVGDKYKKEMPWGLPILILGESHYSAKGKPLSANHTKEAVQEHLDSGSYPFFAKVAGVFQGGWTSPDRRQLFWSCSAFYNFVQETVGAGPRERPTDEMWRKAGAALEEVLIEHKPGFVLVLGKRLWEELPLPSEQGPAVTLPNGKSKDSLLYCHDAGYAFTFGIPHPASFGWSYREWTPWVQAALQAAVVLQNR